MAGSSRYTRAISSEVGEIERRLRILERSIEKLGARASSNARDTADGLGESVASALSSWADRFRQGASSLSKESAAFGKDAARYGTAALNQLRQAFVDAQANHVTAFASSGDGGTTNTYKEPVKNPGPIPYPSVIWPASDPLVTAVGGTYLCTDATTGLTVDSASPPAAPSHA